MDLTREDFLTFTGQLDEAGNPVYEYDNTAWLNYEAMRQELQGKSSSDLAKYLEDQISAGQLGIQSGQLSLDAASKEFQRKLDAWTNAGQRFDSMIGYAIPKGSGKYPGGIVSRPAGQVVDYNPFAEAMNLVNSTPDLTTQMAPSSDVQRIIDQVRNQGATVSAPAVNYRAPSPAQVGQAQLNSPQAAAQIAAAFAKPQAY
jgi:hypothetical protein